MDYVIANDIKVSNNSWGGGGFSQALYDVIEASQAIGHIFVAAAGNDTLNNDATPHYPSSYDLPNIISVAATDNDDALASFSNWGLNSVDLGAPGVAVYSTVLGTDYAFLSGTSMASPHVAGVVALIMSRSPEFTPQQVRDRILESVRPVASLEGITMTGGVLNAGSALGDCNGNGIDDALDIAGDTSEDCTGNGIPDECESDCNTNTVADSCDIAFGTSDDCDGMGRPDECEPDCNTNGVADRCDIAEATSGDCNFNGVPDECEPGGAEDCNNNGDLDLCELFLGLATDCNRNDVPDACDVLHGTSEDCNTDLFPDECEIALEILMSGDASQAFVDSIKDLGNHITRVTGDYSSFPLDLSPYDMLMFMPGGVPDSSPWFYEIVDEFVEAGGGLIRIQDPPALLQFRGLASPVLDAVGWNLRANTQVANASSPLVHGLASTSALTGYSASYTLKPEADVVIAWDDGEPMTVAYAHGAGRVVYFNDLWAAYPDLWGGDTAYGLMLMENTLDFVKVPDRDCNLNDIPDDCDIDAGTSEDCSGDGVPDECEPDCNENGTADSCDILDGTSDDIDGNGVPDECSLVFYVDHDAIGLDNGSNWVDAFTDLEDALTSTALIADTDVDTQIWVAEGNYAPSRRTDPEDPRSATFQLIKYVALYGGFHGGEARFDQRDVRNNVTILSGDLAGDDGPNFLNNEENAYHVVTGDEMNASAILDGFTITGGHAYEGDQYDRRMYGAGMSVYDGSPTVANCVFVANRAFDAAGMFLAGSSPIVANCLFVGNRAGRRGGGLYLGGGTPAIINCVFSGNTAGDDPGYCGRGGGMETRGSGSPVLTNCTFSGNEAFAGPCPSHGGGVSNVGNVTATLANCVLWGNHDSGPTDVSAQISHELAAVSEVNYSCILGWTAEDGGIGNINTDPTFADSDGPDDTLGTIDDNLRLAAGSPCIDAGNNTAVPPDVPDLDRDGNTSEPTPLDLDGAPRAFDDPSTTDSGHGTPPIVDMGPYEHGDCNGNGTADADDIAVGTSEDCTGNGVPDECEPDCNGNTVADSCDLDQSTSEDCNGNKVPDECDLADPTIGDCNGNLTPDNCESDTDTDGLIDECDGCPYDVNKTAPGACGCDAPDDDTDGDTVPDCLDICAGFDDLIDSDSDGTPDGCDRCPGFDDSEDADGDQVPDGCDDCPYEPALAEPSEPGYEITCSDAIDNDCDTLTDEADSDCLCQLADAVVPEPVAFEKNRYLSFSSANSGRRTAVRVTLTDLPTPFDALDDQIMWVSEPREISENAGKVNHEPGWPDSMSANLQCTPYCMDWADVGLLHVTDDEIVPGAVYDVQAIDCACDFGNDADYSAPLTITTSKWGDLVGTCAVIPCTPPDGVVNMGTDVTACVDKFRNLEGAVLKSRADIEPNFPDWLVNIADVTYVLDAFRGFAYPAAQTPPASGWPGPDGCP